MRLRRILCLALFLPSLPLVVHAQDKRPTLPKVVLVGDSIRIGYEPFVAKHLDGKAEVVSPGSKAAGDSAWLLKNLDDFVIKHKPDVIHLNVGLHDLRHDRKKKSYQIEIETYEKNLDAILVRLKKETTATIVFASTTPIDDDRHAKRGGGYDRFEKDVTRYNDVALRVCRKHGVVVHDLHHLVHHVGAGKMLDKDGTHYTKDGKVRLAEAVTDCVVRHLGVRSAKPAAKAGPDPEAAKKYKQAEAERDAQVPAYFKKLKVGEFVAPSDADAWKKQRPKVREIVVQSLGEMPERPKPSARLITREIHPHFTLESLTIPNGLDGEMTAYFFAPHNSKGKRPAVLWLHSSSYDRNQLLWRGHNGGDEPLGETYAKAGYAVLAPDAAWYGGRATKGPSGSSESGRAAQDGLFKYHLWMGRTLWGMFVRDDQVALDYLCTRSEIDAKRIGATGISMGSTRSWWLAALDERSSCAVGVACLTRYQNLIAHGQLRQHGIYYFTFGLLKHFDSEAVISLIAPKPFLALTGDLDAGSPADGVLEIEKRASKTYAAVGAKDHFASILYKDVGHVYTAQMRKEMLAWFEKHLKPD
jgi:dienelactone hydrolase/lysophospholipase L1-like esterase